MEYYFSRLRRLPINTESFPYESCVYIIIKLTVASIITSLNRIFPSSNVPFGRALPFSLYECCRLRMCFTGLYVCAFMEYPKLCLVYTQAISCYKQWLSHVLQEICRPVDKH